MIHRVAIIVSMTAAAGILIVSMAVAGFRTGADAPAAAAAPAVGVDLSAIATPTPTVQTVTDTVYVKPVPAPKVIHVTKPAVAQAPAPTLKPKVIIRHVTRKSHGGEPGEGGDDGGHDSGGD